MNTKVRKFLTILGMVFLVVFGVRELTGKGLYAVAQCTKDYLFERCIGINVNDPTVIIDDFYDHIERYKKIDQQAGADLPGLSEASNLLDDILAKGKPLTRSEFMKFWTIEVHDFIVLDQHLAERSNGIIGVKQSNCYSRTTEWLELKNNFGKPPWHCSLDYFEMHNDKTDYRTPYNWRVDNLIFRACSNESIKQCEKLYYAQGIKNER